MYILGTWKDAVLEKIDADQLPVHWGGTQTDPDGDIYCRSKVRVTPDGGAASRGGRGTYIKLINYLSDFYLKPIPSDGHIRKVDLILPSINIVYIFY